MEKSVFKIDALSRRYQDLVEGHTVVGSPTCPAAVYLELVSHAVLLLLDDQQMMTSTPEIMIKGLEIRAPLGLDTERSIKLILTKRTGEAWNFEVASNKNSDKSTSHSTGIISLRREGSGINDEQDGNNGWTRISNLLDKDTNTEALRGTMVYKMFGKVAKYSSAYRGLRYLVGKGSEGAGDIVMPSDNTDAMARTPNNRIADPVVIDNFMQVPGAFINFLRPTNEDGDDSSIAYICTGMESVGPLNKLKGSGKYRAYTKIVREDSQEAILDVFAFDKESRKIIWRAKGLRFARVPRNSLAKILAGANLNMTLKEQLGSSPKLTIQSPTIQNLDQTRISSLPKNSGGNSKDSIDIFSIVQELLSKSLDIPADEVVREASLEELGIDSLISSEILAHIWDEFKTEVSINDFASATDVASLCSMISSRVNGDNTRTNGDTIYTSGGESENQEQDSDFEIVGYPPSEWQKKVFNILSHSLDVPLDEIHMDSRLEELGTDSLIAGEITNDLKEAFDLDISSTELISLIDVIALCNLIANNLKVQPIQTSVVTSSGFSHTNVTSPSQIDTPDTSQTGENTPRSEKLILIKGNTGLIHQAFQQIRHSFDTHAKETKFTGYWDEVHPQQLNTVTTFIIEAFEKLSCPIKNLRQGERLPALKGPLSKYHREVSRLWEILEEAGIVQKVGDSFLRGPTPLNSDLNNESGKGLSTKLISNFPQYASTHGLPDLLGPHLAECLTGKADPVNLLFGSEKGRSLLEDFYANAPDLRAATQVLCDFFSAAIRSRNSGSEPFRILEIGAGTGGTTKHLIPLLLATGLPFIYTFTELSVSLLARAKKTFKGIVGMEFQKLNIEEDPPIELLGRYHVVVSSNCIHATRDLKISLSNVRKLLQPDGCVALVESTQKLPWYDLVWGLLEGWWLFDDGRKYALQSPWHWERVLRNTGFSHVDWSESASRESRSVRVICGMAGDLEKPCPETATLRLLHRRTSTVADRNLFLAPDGFGSGAVFNALQPFLNQIKNVSVYALNSPFINNKPDLNQIPSVEELAAIYVAEIKRQQPEGPYLVGGYSFGGVVAFEAVRQLLENGNEVEKLFLIDAACPTFVTSLPNVLVGFLDSIEHVNAIEDAKVQEQKRSRPAIASEHFTLARIQLATYKISKLPGIKLPKVVLVSAREGVNKQGKVARPRVKLEEERITKWFLDDRCDDGCFGWDEILGSGINVVRADGNHFSMMMPPMIQSWGMKLAELIDA